MNKQNLLRFIQKYSLGGVIESVAWNAEGNKLSVGSAICARFQNPLRGNLNFAWETTKALRELSVKNQVRTPH